jgi:hypothetical protein
MDKYYCERCEHEKNCNKKYDSDDCNFFKLKQDKSTWYLEGNSGIRHPLDMD